MTSRHRRDRTDEPSSYRAIRVATAWVFEADRRNATLSALGQIAEAAAALAIVLLGKMILTKLPHASAHHVMPVLAPLFAVAAVTSIAALVSALTSQQERLIAERVQQVIWRRMLDAVASVDLVSYESDGFVTDLARTEQNALARPLPTVRSLFALIGAALTAVAMGIALTTFNPWLTPVMLLSAVPTVLLGRMASRSEFSFARSVAPLYMRREYLRSVLTRRQHAAEIRAFGADRMLRPRYTATDHELSAMLQTQVRRRKWLAAGTALASAAALGVVLLLILVLVENGSLSVAEAGSAAIATRLLAGALSRAYSAYGIISEAVPHIDDLQRFLNLRRPVQAEGQRRALVDRVELIDVGFTYPTKNAPALADVNLTIGAGEVVALVGENGSGKSTLARLIVGLFEPGDGAVRWDGRPSIARDRRQSISLLTQDFGRYAMSVVDNIAIGDPGKVVKRDSVERASATAGFQPVVDLLPAGYDTMLGRELDEGTDLSGGQWQRLALARALFRDADLIVLDEPSSALDPRAEAELFDDVRKVLAGRSALLISHRYASARLADRIYVLHHGRIVESGSHDELMAAEGRYAELFRIQSAAFIEGLASELH